MSSTLSSRPSQSSRSATRNTDAAESMPNRANFACGSMRSGASFKLLARYATHQSRISGSVGFDVTEELASMDLRGAWVDATPGKHVGCRAMRLAPSMQFFGLNCKNASCALLLGRTLG